jgi:hypothetical protein
MIKILLFIYEKAIFPVFFTITFGLYYVFIPILWLKLPKRDFKKEYNESFGDIRFLAHVLGILAATVCISYVIIVRL